MVSFLDYVKEISSNPWDNSGVIFSGNDVNTVINRFPKQSGTCYVAPAFADITDMTEYGLVGFWKCEGDEEEITINNNVYYKCDLYMPDSEEVVGYYYRLYGITPTSSRVDLLEINDVIYTKNNQNYKYNNTTSYIGLYFPPNKNVSVNMPGVPITTLQVIENDENKLVVFSNVVFGVNSTLSGNIGRPVAWIDLENQKVIWSPNKNGGTWEDWKYVPGTDKKQISKLGTNTESQSNPMIYINVNDEDYTPYQKYSNQYIFVADNQHYTNCELDKKSEEVIVDVPRKLIEKYGDDYDVRVFGYINSGSGILYDAYLFQFWRKKKSVQDTVYEIIQVIYHPSTKNWCQIGQFEKNGSRADIMYFSFYPLLDEDTNIKLNFIDQSSIDLDIYKKMADIGTGLMLFDDETEDLKYLYDTKNKELYNEYCDLVGTNAITFKK